MVVPPEWDSDLLYLNWWTHLFLVVVWFIVVAGGPFLIKQLRLQGHHSIHPIHHTDDQIIFQKCLVYMLQIVFLTAANVLVIALPLWQVVFHPDSIQGKDTDELKQLQIGFATAWNLIILVDFMEMIILESHLRPELQLHHWSQVVLGEIMYWAVIDDPFNVYLLRLIFLFTQYSCFELPTYISLLLYRIYKPTPAWWFELSVWVYTVLRVAVFVGVFICWGQYIHETDHFGTWQVASLIITFLANFISGATGYVAFVAQRAMAIKKRKQSRTDLPTTDDLKLEADTELRVANKSKPKKARSRTTDLNLETPQSDKMNNI